MAGRWVESRVMWCKPCGGLRLFGPGVVEGSIEVRSSVADDSWGSCPHTITTPVIIDVPLAEATDFRD